MNQEPLKVISCLNVPRYNYLIHFLRRYIILTPLVDVEQSAKDGAIAIVRLPCPRRGGSPFYRVYKSGFYGAKKWCDGKMQRASYCSLLDHNFIKAV